VETPNKQRKEVVLLIGFTLFLPSVCVLAAIVTAVVLGATGREIAVASIGGVVAAFIGLSMAAGYLCGCFFIETALCKPRSHGKPTLPDLTPGQIEKNLENEKTRQQRLWGKKRR
jgi:hypothetical protein